MNNVKKYLSEAEKIGKIGSILGESFANGEKDPLLMTDAEFSNLCNTLEVMKAEYSLLKKAFNEVGTTIEMAEKSIQLAKIMRDFNKEGDYNV